MEHLQLAVCVTIGVAVVLLLCGVLEQQSQNKDAHVAKALIQQASKWYAISLQDKTPFHSLQHADYAMAYLNAARHVSNDTILERVSGIDVHKLFRSVDAQQKSAAKELLSKTSKPTKLKNTQATWLSD